MCGEHLDAGSEQKPCPGSSPHVRGALLRLLIAATIGGIIPACAGSTDSLTLVESIIWDHPRMCGEHWWRIRSRPGYRGSSPHVRGAPEPELVRPAPHGIIPACAGSTRPIARPPVRQRDHPRMCGEHVLGEIVKLFAQGSSPHVRGAHCLI